MGDSKLCDQRTQEEVERQYKKKKLASFQIPLPHTSSDGKNSLTAEDRLAMISTSCSNQEAVEYLRVEWCKRQKVNLGSFDVSIYPF